LAGGSIQGYLEERAKTKPVIEGRAVEVDIRAMTQAAATTAMKPIHNEAIPLTGASCGQL
jgi:hypothetical protein